MKRESLLLFWLTTSIILAVILIAIVFVIFHVIAFPDGRFVGSADNVIEIVAMITIFGLFPILYLFSWTYRLTRKEIVAAATFRDATEHKIPVKVISKLTRGFGNLSLTGSQHIIAFEFPDRTRKSFEVDTIQYSVIVEGDTGLLTYKRNREHHYFVAFELL